MKKMVIPGRDLALGSAIKLATKIGMRKVRSIVGIVVGVLIDCEV